MDEAKQLPAQIERLDELFARISPLPWFAAAAGGGVGLGGGRWSRSGGFVHVTRASATIEKFDGSHYDNNAFIAELVNAWPTIRAALAAHQPSAAEPVGRVDEGDDGMFIEILLGEDGSPLKRGDLVYAAAAAAAPPVAVPVGWPKLDKPAKVGSCTFGVDVSSRLVVEAAQRIHEYTHAHEQIAECLERARNSPLLKIATDINARRWQVLEDAIDSGGVSVNIEDSGSEQWDGQRIINRGDLQDWADAVAPAAARGDAVEGV